VKKITFVVVALLGACVFGTPGVSAQDAASQPSTAAAGSADAFSDQQMALLRKDIRSIKKQLIAANLTLTDGEATKFWPMYEQYSVELGKINDTRASLIKEYANGYGTLTDEPTALFAAGSTRTSLRCNFVKSTSRSYGRCFPERKRQPSFSWTAALA